MCICVCILRFPTVFPTRFILPLLLLSLPCCCINFHINSYSLWLIIGVVIVIAVIIVLPPPPRYPHCGFAALFIQNNLNRHYLCIQHADAACRALKSESAAKSATESASQSQLPLLPPPPPCVRATFTDSFGFVFAFHLYFNALHKRILILIRCLVQCDIREHTHIHMYICIKYIPYICLGVCVVYEKGHLQSVLCSTFN